MQQEDLFSPPDSPEQIIWDDNSPPEIRAASLDILIEKLCHETYFGAKHPFQDAKVLYQS
jgi:hypothetical protein